MKSYIIQTWLRFVNTYFLKQKAKEKCKRYICFNAEFQRIARRDKAFLRDQCKEIEENNRMGKTRGHFKEIRDTKWIFHAKMATVNDRHGMDLNESKILRRGGKNTGELYKKDLHNQIIMMV